MRYSALLYYLQNPQPRWTEGASSGGTGLIDQAAGGIGLIDSAGAGTGILEGGGSL